MTVSESVVNHLFKWSFTIQLTQDYSIVKVMQGEEGDHSNADSKWQYQQRMLFCSSVCFYQITFKVLNYCFANISCIIQIYIRKLSMHQDIQCSFQTPFPKFEVTISYSRQLVKVSSFSKNYAPLKKTVLSRPFAPSVQWSFLILLRVLWNFQSSIL